MTTPRCTIGRTWNVAFGNEDGSPLALVKQELAS
jgi:hypothetical protein